MSIVLNGTGLIINKKWGFDSQLRPSGLQLRLFATELLFIVLSIDHVERDDVQQHQAILCGGKKTKKQNTFPFHKP